MKKVLAVILAVMMIATCVPMAFAEGECEHEFNAESMVRPNVLGDGYYVCQLCGKEVVLKRADYTAFDKAYVSWTAYNDNVYVDDEIGEKVWIAFEDATTELAEYIESNGLGDLYSSEYNYSIFNHHEGEQVYVDEMTEILVSNNIKIEAILAEYENPILFDGIVFAEGEYYLNLVAASFTDEEYNTRCEELVLRNSDDLYASVEKYEAIMRRIEEDRSSVTEEEYTEAMTGAADFFIELSNCIAEKHNYGAYIDNGDGTHKAECSFCVAETSEKHVWGKYISNGDATVFADGTKTAECKLCDAEDTVVDEGSKIIVDEPELPSDEPEGDEEPANFFTNIFAKIKSFFESIANFFKNLFA